MESGAPYGDPLDNKHDKGYKYILSVKKVFVELLRSFVDQGWVSKIDENNVERIDKSFILKDFREKEADLIYKVKFDEREVFFYILLELQSTVDFQIPYRLLQYMMEIWRAILRDTGENVQKQKNYKLPVIVPCLLYNGKDNWTACRSFRETLECSDIFKDYILDFKYILFDVKRYHKDDLLKLSNIIGTVFLADQNLTFEKQLERLHELMLKTKSLAQDEQNMFVEWVKNIFIRGMPEEKVKTVEKLIIQSKEDVNMVYALEESIREEFLKYHKQGIERGIEQEKVGVIIKASKMGLPLEDISELVSLSVDEVKKIIDAHQAQ